MNAWQMLNVPLSSYSLRITSATMPTSHDSSASNMFFGSLQNMRPWNLDAVLTILGSLIPYSVTLFPIQLDATYDLCLEADVIRAAHVYLVHPVNVILRSVYPQSNILCRSEVSEGRTYSRLDMYWKCNDVVFAVLEYKRPYSIDYSDWNDAMTGFGQVTGNGLKIARQLKKYAYYCARRTLVYLTGLHC
ncbi:hypothetical protein V1525DRAFT_408649 [Lipomyces kononenkoae]|uniref:Uncharacterized protein n=1 Tax=Lipomyces kononenkoae TaxID=34357 RepID=A0ACC3SWU6_LIPKO